MQGNLIDICELKMHLVPKSRIAGLDVGSKTIGIAISDQSHTIATPREILQRTKFKQDINKITELVEKESICAIIVGFPVNMDGSEGPRCQSTRQFVENITPHVHVPIVLWDERMSTQAADRAMLEADLSRAKRKKNIDKAAASFILQGALDFMKWQA